jgi:RNA polymerase sigma factor (TIGR02999 family)
MVSRPDDAADFTSLLARARGGDDDAVDALFVRVYEELRHLAHKVRQNDAENSLNTTALVHEAYLKLVRTEPVSWESRLHFFRVAATAMRHVLVNSARARIALKRGGAVHPVSFREEVHGRSISPETVIEIDDALTRLAGISQRKAQVAECRFFVGLSVEEAAEVLDISPTTVKRDWRAARAWLALHLAP